MAQFGYESRLIQILSGGNELVIPPPRLGSAWVGASVDWVQPWLVWEGADCISYRVVECGGASCIPPCRAGGGVDGGMGGGGEDGRRSGNGRDPQSLLGGASACMSRGISVTKWTKCRDGAGEVPWGQNLMFWVFLLFTFDFGFSLAPNSQHSRSN